MLHNGPYLHPAPAEPDRVDHRDTANRQQSREPTDLLDVWRRAVETLADELQIEPIAAHELLRDGYEHMTIGLAWEWWLP